jgi:hypothetical protein
VRTRWVLVAVALLTAVIQFLSARGEPDKTLAPLNAAQEIAAHLAWEGRYVGGNWVRLKGVVRPEDPPLRAFNLPGYVWYAAAMWRAFPRAHRYIQIPVVVLLTVAVAATAAALGGPMLGLLSGLVAALDPFMVVHGPVWDDAVFGTTLEWLIFAIAVYRWRQTRSSVAWTENIIVMALAGLAALTRTEAQAVLLVLTAVVWALPSLRALRRTSLFAALGVVIAVSAWGVRNESAIGTFLTGSTHDGITLWESNGPAARQALRLGQVDRLSENPSVMQPYWSATMPMTEAGADSYFRRAALRYISAHPVETGKTAFGKLVVSVSGVRPERDLNNERNLVSIIDNGLLLVLSLAAVFQLTRRPPRLRHAVLLVMITVSASAIVGLLLIGPAGIRYWLTLRGMTWMLSAWELLHLGRTVSRNQHDRGTLAAR